MGTATVNSKDPRTPVQRRGNLLVLFVTLAMVGAITYGYFYVKTSKDAGPGTGEPRTEETTPFNQATPVTQE